MDRVVISNITQLASGGPKTFGYIVYSPTTDQYHEVCKVKTICINFEVAKDVNVPTCDMIQNDDTNAKKKIASRAIRRTDTHEVITRDEEKLFRVTNAKDFAITIPFVLVLNINDLLIPRIFNRNVSTKQ